MNPQVDLYLAQGCGRCSLFATPQCKVHNWQPELALLRSILLSCGLTEELKWKMPCYTHNNKNILILTAFKEHCSLNFFKGALLADTHNLLTKPGENTQAGRQMRFTDVKKIAALEAVIKSYVFEAIEAEKSGIKVETPKKELEYPEELQVKFNESPALKSAFESLTPGRQRAYIIYFTQPKQSATKTSRIEKCTPDILMGKGLNGR